MPSEISELSPVLYELKIEVPWTDVNAKLEENYASLQKNARIRGFRPGKVPRNVVKQMFAAQVKNEVMGVLVERSIFAAAEEHSLSLVAIPEVDPEPIADGKPLVFKAKVEVKPKVDKIDTASLVLTRPAGGVTPADIDAEVERMRQDNAEMRALDAPRAAKAGDVLTVDYTVSVDGAEKPDMAAQDRPIELGTDRLLPEFEAGLTGAKTGETKKVEVKFADDHGRQDLRGKTAHFSIVVKDMKEKVLPTVDDEFAKDMGEFENLAALRASIETRLEAAYKTRSENELKEQVVDKLVEKNPIPVPPSLVEQQERAMLQEIFSFMQMTGQDMPMTEEMHKSMHERAERKVRAAILMGELARREKMDVTPEEVEAKLHEIARRTGKHVAKVRVEYQGERRGTLESQILEGKLLEYLLAKATITDAPAEAAGAAADGAGAEDGGAKKKAAPKSKKKSDDKKIAEEK